MTDILDLQPGAPLQGTPYRVVRKVGAGGMGAVFEIEHVRLKKRLVAKTLHPGLRTRDDFLARMETEAQTLARIAHPNIVVVHDLGVTANGIPFFVMEKLDGSDLRRLLRSRRSLDLADALTIVEDVLEALAHAHREGVVHRDIKPENVFLARSGVETVTKVLDFGIAKILDDPRNLTGERFLGTPQYASPEQLRGETATEKTDLYAVGCVLFELVTGRRPFSGPTSRDFMLQHLNDPAPRISTYVAVPRELDDLVASALEKDAAKRPLSALAFARRIHQIRQVARNVELAQANTTEEMLLTAITHAPSSGSLPAAGAPTERTNDTVRDPVPNVAMGTTEEQPPERTAPLAPRPDDLRAAPTRTGKAPVPAAPTDEMSLSEHDALEGRPRSRRTTAHSAMTASHASHSEVGVALASTVLPRRDWARRAIIAAPIGVGILVASLVLWKGRSSDSSVRTSAAPVTSLPAAPRSKEVPAPESSASTAATPPPTSAPEGTAIVGSSSALLPRPRTATHPPVMPASPSASPRAVLEPAPAPAAPAASSVPAMPSSSAPVRPRGDLVRTL